MSGAESGRACRSDTEVGAHDLVCQLADSSLGNSTAVGDDTKFVGHAARERQLLLNEKHGEAILLVQLQEDAADFVNDVGLDSFAGLIENQQLRLQDKRSADRQLLLLTAGKIAAAAIPHLFQHRK